MTNNKKIRIFAKHPKEVHYNKELELFDCNDRNFNPNDLQSILTIPTKSKHLSAIIANVIYKQITIITLNTSLVTKEFKEIIYDLEKNNYIDLQKGNYDIKSGEKRRTKIKATPKLRAYIKTLVNHPCVRYKEPPLNQLLLVRDKNKKVIPYNETPRAARIQKILKEVNRVNNNYNNITLQGEKLTFYCQAKYKDSIRFGGRIYTNGHVNPQQLSQEERRQILMNGSTVVEFDYSAIHPYLLYAKLGDRTPKNEYAYDIKAPILELIPENKRKEFLKVCFQILLNTKARGTANAIRNKLKGEYEEINEKVEIKHIRELITAFLEKHEKIKDFLQQGRREGSKYQKIDAGICLDVLREFKAKKLPIIPIHDSFVVAEEHEEFLIETMAKAYEKVTAQFWRDLTKHRKTKRIIPKKLAPKIDKK